MTTTFWGSVGHAVASTGLVVSFLMNIAGHEYIRAFYVAMCFIMLQLCRYYESKVEHLEKYNAFLVGQKSAGMMDEIKNIMLKNLEDVPKKEDEEK